jgi:hypothetical protein
LRAFVHNSPPVAVVFTSRTEAASLEAAAPSGEGFTYAGQPLWQAREGRVAALVALADLGPAAGYARSAVNEALQDSESIVRAQAP